MNWAESQQHKLKFHEMRRVRKANAKLSVDERSSWGYTGSPISDYEASFGCPVGFFNDHMAERQALGRGLVALDFASEGQALRGISPLDAGLAVSLSDMRDDEGKRFDEEHNISHLSGDALSKGVWRNMHSWLEKKGAGENKFDVIICRPLGGMFGLPDFNSVHFFVLQNMYQLLSRDYGLLMTQVPFWRLRPSFVDYFEQLGRTEGVDVVFGDSFSTLVLEKHPNAPEVLPKLDLPASASATASTAT